MVFSSNQIRTIRRVLYAGALLLTACNARESSIDAKVLSQAPVPDDSIGVTSAQCNELPQGPMESNIVVWLPTAAQTLALGADGFFVVQLVDHGIIKINASGTVEPLVSDLPLSSGLRYRPDGALIATFGEEGVIAAISNDGKVSRFEGHLDHPNNLYADFDGSIWTTEQGETGKIRRILVDGSMEVIHDNAQAAGGGGVLFDADRRSVFFTKFNEGRIYRKDFRTGVTADAEEILHIEGAQLGGLVMDVCGNLYVMDQHHSVLYRLRLDRSGAPRAEVEALAALNGNVTDIAFGMGPHFEETSIYAMGHPGVLYSIQVGVTGKRIPMP